MQAKIWNYSQWINICDSSELREAFENALKKSGFNILGFIEHYFVPYGYTALWLLGESHFALHTFPECNRSYIELSSCNEDYYNKMVKSLNQTFT